MNRNEIKALENALQDAARALLTAGEALRRLAADDTPGVALAPNVAHYAVVDAEATGSIVRPEIVCTTIASAKKHAKRAAKRQRRRRGSGAYVVIPTEARTSRDVRYTAEELELLATRALFRAEESNGNGKRQR
jgi:hypothetical protein